MEKSLQLLDQMIEIAKQEDLENKIKKSHEKFPIHREKPWSDTMIVGESWWLAHLKNLRELIILENVDSTDSRPVQEKS
jgi:hypothetical protein